MSSVWKLFHVTLLGPRIERLLQDFWIVYIPASYVGITEIV